MLQSAIVTGGAALRIAAEKGSAESVLHADNIEIGMAPDGTTLTSLNARDHVVFDLSAAKEQPAKKVTSNALVASGEAGKGLTVASFTEGVEYQETGGTPPVKRTVTSRTLDTSLKGGLGQIQEATFIGSARFRDAATRPAGSRVDHAIQHGDRSGGAHRRDGRAGAARRQRADPGRCDQHRHERRRVEDAGVRRVEARAVHHVSGKAWRKGRLAHARPDEAGPASQRRQPRARLHGRRERLDRAHGHGHARAGREERDADQGRQDYDRRQDRQSRRARVGHLADGRAGREPDDKGERGDALDGIRAADAVRRRAAQGHLHDEGAPRRPAGGFDRRDDRAHAGRERPGHRAARSIGQAQDDGDRPDHDGRSLTYVAAKEEYTVIGKEKLVRTFRATKRRMPPQRRQPFDVTREAADTSSARRRSDQDANADRRRHRLPATPPQKR